jgi:nucleotide-binding universal stress UspA family protein
MEKAFRSILVPVDGSPQSGKSLEMALFISKLFKPQVTVIHVVSDELSALENQIQFSKKDSAPANTDYYRFPRTEDMARPAEDDFPGEVLNEVTERLRDDGKALLEDSAARFNAEGLATRQKFVEAADPAEAIVIEAEAGHYDLVVMGNSGDEENERDLHLGSVAKKVALSVKSSILINREKREVKTVLIPVDGSVKEEVTLQKASIIAKASGSKAVLLHVQETRLLKLRPEINEIGLRILNRASKMFEGIPVEQRLATGDPAKVIIQTAQKADIDLIVMSGGGLGALRRLFLGSVSDHVLHHATVPVLLIK